MKEEFEIGSCLMDVEEELTELASALKAFGALLSQCTDMVVFDTGSDYSYGLEMFTRLYVAEQSKIVGKAVKAYESSDIYLIERAKILLRNFHAGAYGHSGNAEKDTKELLVNLNKVIRHKGEYTALAQDLHRQALEVWKQIGGKAGTANA